MEGRISKETEITRPIHLEVPPVVEDYLIREKEGVMDTAQMTADILENIRLQRQNNAGVLARLGRRFGFADTVDLPKLSSELQGEEEKLYDASDVYRQAIVDQKKEVGPSFNPEKFKEFYDQIEDKKIECTQIIKSIPEERRRPIKEELLEVLPGILASLQEKGRVLFNDSAGELEKKEAQNEILLLGKEYFKNRLDLAKYRASVDERIFLETHTPTEAADFLQKGSLHPALIYQAIHHRSLREKSGTFENLENEINTELDDVFVPELRGLSIYSKLTESVLVNRTGGESKLLAHQLLNGYLGEAENNLNVLINQEPDPFLEELQIHIKEAIEKQKERRNATQKLQEDVYNSFSEKLKENEYILSRREKEEILQKGEMISFGPLKIMRSDGSFESNKGIYRPQEAIFEYKGKRVKAVVKCSFTERAVRPGVVPGTGPERSVLENSFRVAVSGLLPVEEAVDVMKTTPITTAREISIPVLSDENSTDKQFRVWAEIVELLDGEIRPFQIEDVAQLTKDQKNQLLYMVLFALARGRTDGADRNIIVMEDGRLVEIDFSSEADSFEGDSSSKPKTPQVSLPHLLMSGRKLTGTPLKLATVMTYIKTNGLDSVFEEAVKNILPVDGLTKLGLIRKYNKRFFEVKDVAGKQRIPEYRGNIDHCGDGRYEHIKHTVQP